MLKLYCPNCGSSNEYISKKPEYCGQCGKTLQFSAAQTMRFIQKPRPELQIEETYEDSEYTEFDKNDFEIETVRESPRQGITLGELSEQKKTGYSRDIAPVNLTKEQIEDNFKRFATPNKKAIEDISEI